MDKIITPAKKKKVKKIRSPEDEIKLARLILYEATKIARLEVRHIAEQVLTDATTIARWERHPFYIA